MSAPGKFNEPLVVKSHPDIEGGRRRIVGDHTGTEYAVVRYHTGQRFGNADLDANAARIVATVNACAALPDPSVVADLVAFVRAVIDEDDEMRAERGSNLPVDGYEQAVDDYATRARALLARIEP